MELPPCIHRGRLIGNRVECDSNKLVPLPPPNGLILRPASVCHRCPYADRPNRKLKSRGVGDTLAKLLSFVGVTQARWSRWFGKQSESVEVEHVQVTASCGCQSRQNTLNEILPYKET